MSKLVRLALALCVAASLAVVFASRPASAHPMGNFSINRYSAITLNSDHVDVRYIVDMAEIPTFSELGTIRDDRSTDLTQSERDAYIARKVGELLPNISLVVDGRPVALSVKSSTLSFLVGQFNSPTLRLELGLTAKAAVTGQGSLQYNDNNFVDHLGWKEVIAVPGNGVKFVSASVPSTDISKGLTDYSPDAISRRPNATSATVSFEPGVAIAGIPQQAYAPSGAGFLDITAWINQLQQSLTDLLQRKDLPLDLLLIGMGVAFVMGAAHALSPGHGKTIVAAYLVGSRGTPWHAVLLGLTVTFTHTVGVFLLGLAVLSLQQYIVPEALYPWLGFLSGALIMLVGLALFVQRFRVWRSMKLEQQGEGEAISSQLAAVSPHTHTHDGHTHSHVELADHSHNHEGDHEHEHEHRHEHAHDDPTVPHRHLFGKAHTHLPQDGQKVSLGSLLALGISGGIVPCPSALVVLLVAVRFGRVDLGLLLIIAFSLGLAVVLTAIGLLMVFSRGLFARVRFSGGLLARLPMASALAVCGLGVILAINSLAPL